MHQQPGFKLAHFLQICVLLTAIGCRHLPNPDQTGEEWDPEFLRVVKPAFFHLSPSEQVAFGSLYDGGYFDEVAVSVDNVDGYYSLFFAVLAAPVVEHPEFWATIINNPEREQLVRWHCLQALLLRHLELGDPVVKLRRLVGSDDWFTENNFRLPVL